MKTRSDGKPESPRPSGALFVPSFGLRSFLTLSSWIKMLLSGPMNGDMPAILADRVAGFRLVILPGASADWKRTIPPSSAFPNGFNEPLCLFPFRQRWIPNAPNRPRHMAATIPISMDAVSTYCPSGCPSPVEASGDGPKASCIVLSSGL